MDAAIKRIAPQTQCTADQADPISRLEACRSPARQEILVRFVCGSQRNAELAGKAALVLFYNEFLAHQAALTSILLHWSCAFGVSFLYKFQRIVRSCANKLFINN